ncbi:MAG: hypothetical protein EHM35_11875 [Planctomycetaceae bacterium]|nr:MAG: hypothetical protein EHM35_11875 [Planctomycetaceae bacterium]
MEHRRTMAPSVYARAAMMRRAASRRRTVNVNRTPNAPLAPSFEVARDALELALDQSSDVRPEHQRGIRARIATQSVRPRVAGHDTFGPVLVQGNHTRYGVHYRTRLVGAERVRYKRTDAWARERSLEVGQAKVAEVVAERYAYPVRDVRVGNGGLARIWTAKGQRPRFRDYSTTMVRDDGDSATDDSLWAERWGILDGQAYRFRFHRETGEMKRA